MGDYTTRDGQPKGQQERGGHVDKNPDVLRLEMGAQPNDPEKIDYFSRLTDLQIYKISLARSLNDKGKESIRMINELREKALISLPEIEFLNSRRASLKERTGKTDEDLNEYPFVALKSLCDNLLKLLVSRNGLGRKEHYGMLEPKANINQTNFGNMPDPTKKPGLFSRLSGKGDGQ